MAIDMGGDSLKSEVLRLLRRAPHGLTAKELSQKTFATMNAVYKAVSRLESAGALVGVAAEKTGRRGARTIIYKVPGVCLRADVLDILRRGGEYTLSGLAEELRAERMDVIDSLHELVEMDLADYQERRNADGARERFYFWTEVEEGEE